MNLVIPRIHWNERLSKKRKFTPRPRAVKGAAAASAFRYLNRVSDLRIRNLLRGIISSPHDGYPSRYAINELRRAASTEDLAVSSELLLGEEGAFPLPNIGGTNQNLLRPHSLNVISPSAELAFVIGHINGWKLEACTIITSIGEFAKLPEADPVDGMNALASFVERFGASSYCTRKLAYLMSRYRDTPDLQRPYQSIAEKVAQSKFPSPFFTAMELLDDKFDYLSGTSTRVQIQQKYLDGDFRQLLSLNDIAPVPLSSSDLAAIFRKAHSMSLVDEVVSLLFVIHFKEHWPQLFKILEQLLDQSIYSALCHFCLLEFNTSALYSDENPLSADLLFYRRALAFTEFASCAKFRVHVDAILTPRLMRECAPIVEDSFKSRDLISVRDLTKSLQGYRLSEDERKIQACGTFLRTVQFLTYLEQNPRTSGFDQHDFKFICEHTGGLDVLLTEKEIERLYVSSDQDSRPLVTVLALALYKVRTRDEDVDFKFRFALCQIVIERFHSSLEEFIEWLLQGSPQIANYLLSILDKPTLQKLYWLITSADQADTTRQSLLRAVGRQRNSILYFVEADAIEAGRQVAKLRKYFDDSRLYVDSIAFKEWLVANPSAYAQQYMKMIEHNVGVSAQTAKVENGKIVITGEVDAATAFDYILIEVAKIAFAQFCTNRQFGIESYLGRRIRHNTLTGMMRGGVEELIEGPVYRVLRHDNAFKEANNAWLTNYRKVLEHLRRDLLQFHSDAKPQGIFSSVVRGDENTFLALASIRNSLATVRSTELFNELLIRFCWQEINPQLQNASKIISVDFVKNINELIEHHFEHFVSELCGQYRQNVRELVHERFARLASWFRQPEDGFVSASTRQLSDLILVEANDGKSIVDRDLQWLGGGLDIQLDGLSVHRMYDCLFVLLRNALRYSAKDSTIILQADEQPIGRDSFTRVKVSVSSQFAGAVQQKSQLKRLEHSFVSENPEEAMATEGYSGIKKIRYITRVNEGASTASYRVEGDRCIVEFSLTVELANRQSDAL